MPLRMLRATPPAVGGVRLLPEFDLLTGLHDRRFASVASCFAWAEASLGGGFGLGFAMTAFKMRRAFSREIASLTACKTESLGRRVKAALSSAVGVGVGVVDGGVVAGPGLSEHPDKDEERGGTTTVPCALAIMTRGR